MAGKEDRFADLRQEVIKYLVIALIASGLVGGVKYLFFDSETELAEVNELELEIQQEVAEAKAFNDVIKIGATGWFSDSENLEHFSLIIDHIGTNICESALDPVFASSALDWCNGAIMQLNSERGQMSGLTVHYELGHNQQQSFLSEYDTQIELVTEVEDMISNWSNKAVEERKAHFEALSDLFLKASSHASSIVSQAQQIVYDVENVKLKELDQREAEYHHKTRQIQAKRIVAVAGIIVGLAILMALVVSAASPKVKRRRGSRAQARHNPNKRKGRQKR